jgi:hypothetical protein
MIEFPLNPAVGQQFSVGTKSWEWTGVSWDLLAFSTVELRRVDAAVTSAEQAATAAQTAADVAVTAADQLANLTKISVGLGNVDNTADADKPVSTAVATALSLKADKSQISNINNTSDANKPVSIAQQAALDLKAPLVSPGFSGVPTVPTAGAGTNTLQVASTQFVTSAVAQAKADIVNSSPAALDTLNELATALGNDPQFATTTATAIGNRLRVDTAAQGLTAAQQGNAKVNLGLGNVDNTSDANKPVSSAQQTALNAKANLSGAKFTGTVNSSAGIFAVGAGNDVANGIGPGAVFSTGADGAANVYRGFWWQLGAADQARLFIGNQTQTAWRNPITVDTAGTVGIGAPSPTLGAGYSGLHINSDSTPGTQIHLTNPTTGTTAADGLTLSNDVSSAYLWNYENTPLVFGTNSAERLRIAASGAVGVGVIPSAWSSAALQVKATGITETSSGGEFTYNTYQSAPGTWKAIAAGGAARYGQAGDHRWYVGNAATGADIAWTQAMTLGANGNLLIGTAVDNGADKLQVEGSVSAKGIALAHAPLTGVSVSTGSMTREGTVARCYVGDGTGWSWAFSKRAASATTDLVTIKDNGDVLIGSTIDNGTDKLQVTGSIRASNGNLINTDGVYVQTSTSANASARNFAFGQISSFGRFELTVGNVKDADPTTAGIPLMSWTSSGNVGIGNTAPSSALSIGPAVSKGTALAETITFPGYSTSPQYRLLINHTGSGILGIGSDGAGSMILGRAIDFAGTPQMEYARFDASGNLLVGATSGNSHIFVKQVAEGQTILGVHNGSNYSFAAFAVANMSWNAAGCAVVTGKNATTDRSINTAGTINASGADYAEYMTKAEGCGVLTKGQIVGVDAEGKLTDKWAESVSFLIKSTDPSYVGGDVWGSEEALGLAYPTDETSETYAADLEAFNSALEAARQKVDRIAYAGQVPVNVQGAIPGQYVVPQAMADGSIGARLVGASGISLPEYMAAVGIVQNILPDGRANVRVKVV